MKYYTRLINSSGTTFDCGYFHNLSRLKSWARDRGGIYTVEVDRYKSEADDLPIETEYYKCSNNRLFYINTVKCGY